ncbi:DUF72 domain-containing protein [Jatrophihabitans sp.]|uniref:DUF72 domain-containing protein n=1 Tax=Jatrophihabitans sp. TaxID=1932789 RepID=UPI0030C72F84|nr:hypothetical protein [Jatrophihabitans sp.]
MSGGELRIGLSGWSYPGWRGRFYPRGLPHNAELGYVAERFSTVEVNASFYRLQRPDTYRRWVEQTPGGFLFAVKGSRYITHMKRLQSSVAMANFLASGVLALGDRLGPLLWQLPPTMHFDPAVLEPFLTGLPRTMAAAGRLARKHDERLNGRSVLAVSADLPLRHALEVRHESFRDERLYGLLREQGVGLVVADSAGHYPRLMEATADFVYVRLHGEEELYTSGYDDASLRGWAGRIARWRAEGRDVYVYFDNDAKVRAPVDALRLAELCGVASDSE